MKFKGLLIIALVLLVAAGCNKKAEENQPETNSNQSQQTQNNESTPTDSGDVSDAVANSNPQNTPSSPATLESDIRFSGEPGMSDANDQPQVYQIDITKDGFYPASFTIRKGDYVQFVNKDTAKHWPASDPHPKHNDLPGFDAKAGLALNEKFTYQFNTSGEWKYHDHLNPSVKGVMIVQ